MRAPRGVRSRYSPKVLGHSEASLVDCALLTEKSREIRTNRVRSGHSHVDAWTAPLGPKQSGCCKEGAGKISASERPGSDPGGRPPAPCCRSEHLVSRGTGQRRGRAHRICAPV